MSDPLTSASDTLGVPEPLLQRSAEARAAVAGTTPDEVLTAWAGGAATAPSPDRPAETEPAAPAQPEPVLEPDASSQEPRPVAAAVIDEPAVVPELVVPPPEPEVPVEPVGLGYRVRIAARVGAWTGSALGLIGFLFASSFWAGSASVIGDGPYLPVIITTATGVLLGTALVSVPFGAAVATLARSAVAWTHRGMQLSTSPATTAWIGALIGLVLGVVTGAILVGGVGTPISGDATLVQMPVLSTMVVMVIGGAILGGSAAATTQAFSVPVVIEAGAEDEIEEVKGRLIGAISIPVAGLALLVLLVLPFAWVLIRSAHLTAAGAPLIAVFAAAGILTFAALAGSHPNVRISFGELMVAVIGIATVVIVVLSVLSARGPTEEASAGPGGTVGILAREDLTFDATEWSVPEGPVTLVYTDEGDVVHTLAIEGREDEMLLQVETAGQVDQGTVALSPGAYTLYCTIRGHREAGMEGTLNVTPAPTDTADGH